MDDGERSSLKLRNAAEGNVGGRGPVEDGKDEGARREGDGRTERMVDR